MSATGRPEREYRSAQREGTPMSAAGETKARSARRRAIAQEADTQCLTPRCGHEEAEA